MSMLVDNMKFGWALKVALMLLVNSLSGPSATELSVADCQSLVALVANT